MTLKSGKCGCENSVLNTKTGTCDLCPWETFYDQSTKKCGKCRAGCASCRDSRTCLDCKPGLSFNSTSQLCECEPGTFPIGNTCASCGEQQYYNGRTCKFCPKNCLDCNNTQGNCQKCNETFIFNEKKNTCECPALQVSSAHGCVMNSTCPVGSFFDGKTCEPCA